MILKDKPTRFDSRTPCQHLIPLQVLLVPPEDRGRKHGAAAKDRTAETGLQIFHLRNLHRTGDVGSSGTSLADSSGVGKLVERGLNL